jgi:hypothetical protein
VGKRIPVRAQNLYLGQAIPTGAAHFGCLRADRRTWSAFVTQLRRSTGVVVPGISIPDPPTFREAFASLEGASSPAHVGSIPWMGDQIRQRDEMPLMASAWR